MWVVYAALFVATFAVSAILTWVVTKAAPIVRLVDKPGGRKIHEAPMPLGGGVAIAAAVYAAVGGAVAASFVVRGHPEWTWVSPLIRDYAGGVLTVLKQLSVLAAGGAVLVIMGLVDDKWGLRPVTKLSVQALVGVILVAGGMSVSLYLPWKAASWAATVAWMVFVTNAFNLLDNMDGLSSGVAAIIGAVFAVVALETGQVFTAAALTVFVAAVLGFMVFNFPPARIFMGDAGSYFLGYVLGAVAVVFTFVPKSMPQAEFFPLALPFVLFAVPFYDTLSVVYIRLSEGRHIFDADKRHFSHRLTDLGLSKREAVFTVYVATLATAFPALYLYHLNTYSLLGSVVQAVLVLVLVAILEHAGARKKP